MKKKIESFLVYCLIIVVVVVVLQRYRTSEPFQEEEFLGAAIRFEQPVFRQYAAGALIRRLSATKAQYFTRGELVFEEKVKALDLAGNKAGFLVSSERCVVFFQNEGPQNIDPNEYKSVHFAGSVKFESGDLTLKSEELHYEVASERLYSTKSFLLKNKLGWLNGANGFEFLIGREEFFSSGPFRGEGEADDDS